MSNNRDGFIQQLLSLGQLLLPLLVGPQAGEYIALARGLMRFIDEAKDIFGADSPAELEELRASIEARVNAHAGRTIGSLG